MSEPSDKQAYAFGTAPPAEVSRFLKNKGMRPAFSWQDVEPEEHAVAFSVAKATQLDVLETIRAEVQAALDEGLPFAEFKKRLRPQLEKQGWWGKTMARDPLTGEMVEVQLGSPRRLKTIYRANLRSARAAGQWERIERTKDALSFLQYNLGPSERHRPHHEAKAGLVLRVDDPFWGGWMPPNGWGCKCWVRQISAREAARLGVSEPPVIDLVEKVNTRTGEVRWVPEGIDPGWERNPGKQRVEAMARMLDGKLEAVDPMIARAALRDVATSWRVERVLQGAAGGRVPVAVLPPKIADELGLKRGILEVVDAYGKKIGSKTPPVTTGELRRLVDALDEGGLIAVEDVDDKARTLQVFTAERDWHLVAKILPDADELWISTMHRTTPEKVDRILKRMTILRD